MTEHLTPTGAPVSPIPLAYTVKDACAAVGCKVTKLYELVGAGLLDARKIGGRTVIVGDSLRRYVASLPKAVIRTGQRSAA
jgi:hypothetical protein